jgi:hypothetical protein
MIFLIASSPQQWAHDRAAQRISRNQRKKRLPPDRGRLNTGARRGGRGDRGVKMDVRVGGAI